LSLLVDRQLTLGGPDMPGSPGRSGALRLTRHRRDQYASGHRTRLEHRVRAARAAGASWQVIGKELGISRQAAWARFHEQPTTRGGSRTSGVRRAPAGQPAELATYTRALRELVGQARADGATWQAIAGELGISRQAAWARYHSHSPRPERRPASRDEEQLRASVAYWRQQGMSWRRIGRQLHLSHQAVWRRFREVPAVLPPIPQAALDACYENPAKFRKLILAQAETSQEIEAWLGRFDLELGLATGHELPVAPRSLLGRRGLREFLITAAANARTRS
jgi:hypothetical protein